MKPKSKKLEEKKGKSFSEMNEEIFQEVSESKPSKPEMKKKKVKLKNATDFPKVTTVDGEEQKPTKVISFDKFIKLLKKNLKELKLLVDNSYPDNFKIEKFVDVEAMKDVIIYKYEIDGGVLYVSSSSIVENIDFKGTKPAKLFVLNSYLKDVGVSGLNLVINADSPNKFNNDNLNSPAPLQPRGLGINNVLLNDSFVGLNKTEGRFCRAVINSKNAGGVVFKSFVVDSELEGPLIELNHSNVKNTTVNKPNGRVRISSSKIESSYFSFNSRIEIEHSGLFSYYSGISSINISRQEEFYGGFFWSHAYISGKYIENDLIEILKNMELKISPETFRVLSTNNGEKLFAILSNDGTVITNKDNSFIYTFTHDITFKLDQIRNSIVDGLSKDIRKEDLTSLANQIKLVLSDHKRLEKKE